MSTAIRLVLTAVLLWLVYGETGPWTTLVLGLLAVRVELENLRNYLLRETLDQTATRIRVLNRLAGTPGQLGELKSRLKSEEVPA